jgi:hypothetical protein
MATPAVEHNRTPTRDTAERTAEALKQCQELIDHFNSKAIRTKHWFNGLRYITIVLTVGIATVAAVPQVPRWLIAIFSGGAALCAALISATRPQEMWLQSRTTEQQLVAERFLFLQSAGHYSDLDEDSRVKMFAKRIIDIWCAGHERWEQARQTVVSQPIRVEGTTQPEDFAQRH